MTTNTCRTCSASIAADGECVACALEAALLAAPAPSAAEGSEFAGYTLRREIASGGMGVVYEAWQPALKRTVALKMMRGAFFAGTENTARFRTEAEAGAHLDHPHIVPIHEVGEADGQPFFTMKLIEGGPLSERLKQGPMPLREAAAMMEKIARAVHYAHQRGVLHRDLKPGNILLDAAGEPHLTDFGLAKLMHAESSMTLTQTALGTPQYMSPEQAAGRARAVTTTSDVWSLGVVLYQMVSGRLPFNGEGSVEVMRRIVEEEAPGLFEGQKGQKGRKGRVPSVASVLSVPSSDRDIATIVARCLEKDPARRMRSALFLAEELARWLAGEPIQSRRITTRERVWKWVRRHPYRIAAIAMLALSVLAGSVASFVLWRRAEGARVLADANARDARTARDAAAADAYFSTVANALGQRQRFDFAAARMLLAGTDPARRGFEWRLVAGLSRGDEMWTATFGGALPKCLALDRATGRVLALTDDRELHSFDVGTGRHEPAGSVPRAPAELYQNAREFGFRRFEFAPDGRHYFVVEGDVLLVVETASARLLHHLRLAAIEAGWLDSARVLFSESPRFDVEADEPNAHLIDLAAGTNTPIAPNDITGPFALSGDGARIASVRGGRTVEVRRVADGFEAEPEAAFRGPMKTSAYRAAFSADGEHVAAVFHGESVSTVAVYSLASRRVVFEQNWASTPTVAFCPDEPLLVTAGREPWLVTWRFLDPRPDYTTYDDGQDSGNDPHAPGGPFTPPQRLLTRSATGGRAGFLFGHESPASALLFLAGKKAILSAGDDGTVRRWPLASRVPEVQRRVSVETLHPWFHPAASHDGARVVYRGTDGISRLWNRGDQSRLRFPKNHAALAVLSDGRALSRIGATGEIVCWQSTLATPTKGASLTELWRAPGGASIQGFHQIIHSAVSRDERRVAVLEPGKLLVVDLDTRTTRDTADQIMDYGAFPGQSLALSPDGKWIAVTGFKGRRARLYSADDPAAGHTALIPADDPGPHDSACAFSADGARIFIGNEDGWVRVFDTASRKELPGERWSAHTTEITALAVSQRGDLVATAAQGTLALWSVEKSDGQPRRERLRLAPGTARNWMQFGGGDTVLLHSAPFHPIEAWEAP